MFLEEIDDVITTLTKENGIKNEDFLFWPITVKIKVCRLIRSGRTGTKAEKPTNEVLMKIGKIERKEN